MFSAYEKTHDGIWVGVHRLPLKSAIMYCKEFKRRQCRVAIVPDNVDPQPYFNLVEGLA